MNFIMFKDSRHDVTKFTKRVEELFRISMYVKGFDAILEVIGGFLVLFSSPNKLNQFIIFLTQHELNEDPHDFLGNYLRSVSHVLNSNVLLYLSLYLFIHGAIKLFLVVMLLKNKIWAYPLSVCIFILFIAYQIYHYALHPSLGLMLLTIFDALVIILTWNEYKILQKHYLHSRNI